ncbi:MAG: hypothetical protein ACXWRE_10915 [Pseudobdellovibrionaceae bacterium]
MKKRILGIFLFIISVSGAAFLLRPECSPIADEALAHFGIPIEQRKDKDFYLKVFQKKEDGHWYQCKTALTRASFF